MTSKIRYFLSGLAALALAALSARAVTILDANSFWKVTGGTSGLTVDELYQGPFGNADYIDPVHTYWAEFTTINLQTTLNLTGYDLASVEYSIAIDNDYVLSVNGLQIESFTHEGLASYSPWASLTNLHDGINTIDLIAIDRGGGTYFAMQVQADVSPVPEGGATMAMIGFGLLGCVAVRRRFVRA